eukprot:m.253691 g.253691  ORF g.253691 m.253691 type:complete len:300 (+) comp15486_c2_seq2:328-1227(+)
MKSIRSTFVLKRSKSMPRKKLTTFGIENSRQDEVSDYQPTEDVVDFKVSSEEETACCLTKRGKEKVLTYRVRLDGEQVLARIDSGASISMVPGFGSRPKRVMQSPMELTLADGSRTRLRWESQCDIEYPDGSREQLWVVVGPTGGYRLLLAHDWMQRKNVVISYNKGVPNIALSTEVQEQVDVSADLAKVAKARFPEAFEPPSMASAEKMLVVHELKLKEGASFEKVRAYKCKFTHYERQIARETIKELLDKGYVVPSHSHVSSAITFDTKKKKYRMCIDYRRLNEQIDADMYPMPNCQ